MKRAANFLLILILWSTSAYSALDRGELTKAEDFYRAGDWVKARDTYKGLVESLHGDSPASLLYNYGNALFRSGSVTEGYGMLMKAQFLAPFDSEIRQNMAIVHDKISPKAHGTLPIRWFSWWPPTARTFPVEGWLILALAFLATALWGFTLGSFSLSTKGLLLGFACVFFGLTAIAYWERSLPVGMVFNTSKVRSGPDSKFQEITTLEGGSLVNLDETRDGWKKIRFTSESQESVGWLETTAILEIVP